MTASDRTSQTAKRERIIQEMADDLDEELEMELDDSRLDELLDETDVLNPTVDRRVYFRELLRLQGELVKLQDWVQSEKRAAIPPARAASSSASPSASIPASAASPHSRHRASASARNGISSATSRTSPQAAKWCCSTAAGTTAPASNA